MHTPLPIDPFDEDARRRKPLRSPARRQFLFAGSTGRYRSFNRSDTMGSTESKASSQEDARRAEELTGHTHIDRTTAAVSLLHLAAEVRANYRVHIQSVASTPSYSDAQTRFKVKCVRRRSAEPEEEEKEKATRQESVAFGRSMTARFG